MVSVALKNVSFALGGAKYLLTVDSPGIKIPGIISKGVGSFSMGYILD
jgi:hypothetical protein